MKSIGVGGVTIVVGYILLTVFSGVVGDWIHMGVVGQGICAILLLTEVISTWGYLILKELRSNNSKE